MIGSANPELVEQVIRRTVELGQIPAPPLHERHRAQRVASWWRTDGLTTPEIDAAGNVRCRIRGGQADAIVVCAHLDTVFDHDVPHEVRREQDRLTGPGVGDDTIAVAALSTLDQLLPRQTPTPVWIIATVGEEGIGNLTGIQHVLDHPPHTLGAVVAIEGNYLGRVCTTGVGSRRWEVRLTGPGGHAWEQYQAPSATHAAAQIISRLVALATEPGEATINIGRMGGGEAINARAKSAWFELDVRATSAHLLGDLVQAVQQELQFVGQDGLHAEISELGVRPAGSVALDHPLVTAAIAALESIGRGVDHRPASTDVNAAYARGLPAVTVGVTTGQREHTLDEYVDLPPLGDGLTALARTVWYYQEHLNGC